MDSATISATLNQKLSFDWHLIFEFTEVLLWPLIVGGSILMFRKNISSLIDRIIKITGLGGMEINANAQLKPTKEEDEIAKEKITKLTKELEETKKSYEEELTNKEKNTQFLLSEISIRDIQIDFERIYNSIFGSQISLLRKLESKSIIGDSRRELLVFFIFVQRDWYPVFQNWSLYQYLNFLLTRGLIDYTKNDNYRITEKGSIFLAYISSLGYLENKRL